MSFSDRCTPIFIIILFLCTYYSYVVELCILKINTILKRNIFLVCYHLCILPVIVHYFTTMFIRSPPVPSFYRFGQAEIDALNRLEPTDSNVDTILERFCYFRGIQTYTRKNNRIRYCMKCKHIKPDRTHHCSSCKICVLKMDHHCPWINNCIHFDNYKIYFLLLIFTSIYCIYYAATCAEYVYVFFLFREGYIVWRELTYILSGISLLLAAMAVIALLGFHIALMLKNQTTLEAIAEPMFIDNCTYDLGTAENFFEVFGYNCCLWCLPIPSALGNGVHFPIRYY